MNSLAEMLMWRTPQQPKKTEKRKIKFRPQSPLRAEIIEIITKEGRYISSGDIAKRMGTETPRHVVWNACENLKKSGQLKNCFIHRHREVWGLNEMEPPKSLVEQTLAILPATVEEVAQKMRLQPRQAYFRIESLKKQGLIKRSVNTKPNGNTTCGPHHSAVWERKT